MEEEEQILVTSVLPAEGQRFQLLQAEVEGKILVKPWGTRSLLSLAAFSNNSFEKLFASCGAGT